MADSDRLWHHSSRGHIVSSFGFDQQPAVATLCICMYEASATHKELEYVAASPRTAHLCLSQRSGKCPHPFAQWVTAMACTGSMIDSVEPGRSAARERAEYDAGCTPRLHFELWHTPYRVIDVADLGRRLQQYDRNRP
jgi:hypothetical protein